MSLDRKEEQLPRYKVDLHFCEQKLYHIGTSLVNDATMLRVFWNMPPTYCCETLLQDLLMNGERHPFCYLQP